MRKKTASLGRRVVVLCLSQIVALSLVWSSIVLLSMSKISSKNIQKQAQLAMSYLEADIKNALQPAVDMAEYAAAFVPRVPSYETLKDILESMLPAFPTVFEIYYGTTASRFDGGNFVSATGWNPYFDNPSWDQVKRPWFIDGMANIGKTVITEPYEDTSTGEICLTIVHTVDDGKGGVMGVVGIDVYLSTLTRIINSHKITSDGDTFIVDEKGLIMVHSNANWVLKKNLFEDANINGGLLRKEDLKRTGSYVATGENRYAAIISSPSLGWNLVSTGSLDELTADFKIVFLLAAASAAALALIAVISSFIFGKKMAKPITKLYGVLQTIAKGDLTGKIETKNKTEIGEMIRMLSFTQSSMASLAGSIKKEALVLQKVGYELDASMTETAATIKQISTTIENIKKQTSMQSETVDKTNAGLKDAADKAISLNKKIGEQAQTISRSSSIISAMITSVEEVMHIIIEDESKVEELKDAIENGKKCVHEVSSHIGDISKESESLLSITDVLADIASQTNLLSMNAAIEASHTGESGKGFAVVAGEIRKLAESSNTQSKTIAAVLKKIKSMIDSISRMADEVMDEFSAIELNVKAVSDSTGRIHASVEKQKSGSREVSSALSDLKVLSESIGRASRDVSSSSERVLKENAALSELSYLISNGMDETSGGVSEINKAIRRIQLLSNDNKENIESLTKSVGKFKT
ncbi:MAG: methyl-accepting chemotaxis protein [Spirochaetaceae bacterium]|nr:methyl-accepting chemotaxis protein [Spirochaetaceae bacterium]